MDANIRRMLHIFTDPRCLEHAPPAGFPERAERVRGIAGHLRRNGWDLSEKAPPELAVEAPILAVHAGDYLERFRQAMAQGEDRLDTEDNPLSAGTWNTAMAAVATALQATAWVEEAPGRHGFALIRPPGHHAEHAMAMGFCYVNNVAVVAQHLIARRGLAKVAILDFDVHHGNGTQHLFEERPDVLYVSLHQYPFYPGTGARSEIGLGAGEGATLNVPLPAGSGDARYLEAYREEVLPALRAFAPEMLLVSAGFDAWKDDPLGGMEVSLDGFAHWGEMLGELADEVCAGRSVSLLEGGYDVARLPELVEHYLLGLSGRRPRSAD